MCNNKHMYSCKHGAFFVINKTICSDVVFSKQSRRGNITTFTQNHHFQMSLLRIRNEQVLFYLFNVKTLNVTWDLEFSEGERSLRSCKLWLTWFLPIFSFDWMQEVGIYLLRNRTFYLIYFLQTTLENLPFSIFSSLFPFFCFRTWLNFTEGPMQFSCLLFCKRELVFTNSMFEYYNGLL